LAAVGRAARISFVFAPTLAIVAGAAFAFTDPVVDATLTPNRAGAASSLRVVATGGSGSSSEAFPTSASIFVQRGFVVDLRAVAVRCSFAAANRQACPRASRVGIGSATVRASGIFIPGGSATFQPHIEAFLAPAPAGALAGVVLAISEARTGMRVTARGRLIRLASGPDGYELRLDNLGSAQPPQIPGVTVTLERLEFGLGAKRTITRTRRVKRGGRRVTVRSRTRVSLITNPSACDSAGWRATVKFRQAGSDVVRDMRAACRS
jgi:hypothetical protein